MLALGVLFVIMGILSDGLAGTMDEWLQGIQRFACGQQLLAGSIYITGGVDGDFWRRAEWLVDGIDDRLQQGPIEPVDIIPPFLLEGFINGIGILS